MFNMMTKETNLQERFLEYVASLESIKEVLKKDILTQLQNKGESGSCFSNLVNSVKSVLPKESFQNFVVIGGTFVSIHKGNEIIFPKTNYRELHSLCPQAINAEGKIINVKLLLDFLTSKIKEGESVFLDFGFPTQPLINKFGLADGLVLKNTKGGFVRKGHNLQHIQDIQIADYISGIINAKCSTANDVIAGLLPDYDIHVIAGTGVNIGFRFDNLLVNLEVAHFESEFLFRIPNLAESRNNLGFFVSGGSDKIISLKDYWGIPGVYNCLSENFIVQNAKEVFVRANQEDKLAKSVLIYAKFLVEIMLESIIEHCEFKNPKINYTGSVIKPLLESNFTL
jgi:hypothetical protein